MNSKRLDTDDVIDFATPSRVRVPNEMGCDIVLEGERMEEANISFLVSPEIYTAASSTFRVIQGEKASLRVIKKFDYLPNDVFYRRLPDNWNYSTNANADKSLPFTFENVSQADAGIYILGNRRGSYTFGETKTQAETMGAYFHLIVQGKMGMLYGN